MKERSISNLVKIRYESNLYEVENLEYIRDTIIKEFKDDGYCYDVICNAEYLEFIVIYALYEYTIRYVDYFKYKNYRSDIFDYMHSMRLAQIVWWDKYEQVSGESINIEACSAEAWVQVDGFGKYKGYCRLFCWQSKSGGKFG